MLSACSGGSGADVEENPGTAEQRPGRELQRPGAVDAGRAGVQDQPLGQHPSEQSLRLVPQRSTGGQAPMFARRDDINFAYAAANGVVTLTSPQDSTMVTQGRRRPQLLAREQRGVRRHLDHLDHELGRRDRVRTAAARSSSSRRCCAIPARARTSRPTRARCSRRRCIRCSSESAPSAIRRTRR